MGATVWQRFCTYSTLHGIRAATDSNTSLRRRYFWMLCMVGAALWVISSITISIINVINPVLTTKISTLDNPSLRFPGFMICDNNMYSKAYMVQNPRALAAVLRYTPTYLVRTLEKILPRDVMEEAIKINSDPSHMNINMTKVMVEASPARSVTDLVNAVYIQTEDMFYKGDNLTTVYQPELNQFGLCHAFTPVFNISRSNHASGVWVSLKFSTNDFVLGSWGSRTSPGALLMIREAYSSPESSENTIIIPPGLETMLPIRLVKRVRYPSEQCFETNSPHFKNFLSTSAEYTWEGCTEECKANATVDLCGCKTFYSPGTARVCNTFRDARCQNSAELDGEFWKCHTAICRPKCTQYEYKIRSYHSGYPTNMISIGGDVKPKDGISVMVFFETLQILTNEEVTTTSVSSLMGSIGGLLGLFFGASLFTIAEFLELLILLLTQKLKPTASISEVPSTKPRTESKHKLTPVPD